jgi:hypothetical protein
LFGCCKLGHSGLGADFGRNDPEHWRKVGLIDFDAEMPPVDPVDDEQYYAVQDEQEEEMEFLTGGTFNEEGLQGPMTFSKVKV